MDEKVMKDRSFKKDKIMEEYDARNIQKDIAEKFNMSKNDVAKVTKLNNCKHTRKVTEENRKKGDMIRPLTTASDYDFLDKYPNENFEK